MKIILILSFSFIFISKLYSQVSLPVSNATGRVYYEEIVPVDSVNADMLYIYAKIWAAEFFRSSNESIQMDDKQFHVFVAKGIKIYNPKGLWESTDEEYLHYTIKVETRDERFKLTITDFYFERGITITPAENFIENKKSNEQEQNRIDKLAKSILNAIRTSIDSQNSINKTGW